MRKAKDILDEEMKKLNPKHFMLIFYKVNRNKIIKIIKNIQKDAIKSTLKQSFGLTHNYHFYKNKWFKLIDE